MFRQQDIDYAKKAISDCELIISTQSSLLSSAHLGEAADVVVLAFERRRMLWTEILAKMESTLGPHGTDPLSSFPC